MLCGNTHFEDKVPYDEGHNQKRQEDLVVGVQFFHAGFEIAVASTKAYISQVGIVVALALYMAETLNGLKYEALKTELTKGYFLYHIT